MGFASKNNSAYSSDYNIGKQSYVVSLLQVKVESPFKFRKERRIYQVKMHISDVSQRSTPAQISNVTCLHSNSYYNGKFKNKI